MTRNQDKAKALLVLLGDRAKDILSLMSPDASELLTSGLGNRPQLNPKEINALVQELEDEINRIKFGDTETSSPEKAKEDPFLAGIDDESDSFLNSGSMDLDDEDPIPPRDPSLRSPEKIAQLLEEEKVQIAAFLLSRLEEDFRDEIQAEFSEAYQQMLAQSSVDVVPLGDSVYQKIYDKVCKKSEEELLEETAEF